MVTQPVTNGWFDSNIFEGVGDICNYDEAIVKLGNDHLYNMRAVWSNAHQACLFAPVLDNACQNYTFHCPVEVRKMYAGLSFSTCCPFCSLYGPDYCTSPQSFPLTDVQCGIGSNWYPNPGAVGAVATVFAGLSGGETGKLIVCLEEGEICVNPYFSSLFSPVGDQVCLPIHFPVCACLVSFCGFHV